MNSIKHYVKIRFLQCCNAFQKSNKTPSIIYADLESLIKKVDGCKNNPAKSSTTKVGKHFPSGYSVPKICTYNCIENKDDVNRGEDCMKKIFEDN